MAANLYFQPENFKLLLHAVVRIPIGHDEEILAVWKTIEGNKFSYAFDRTCGCFNPFEGAELKDLLPLNKSTEEKFKLDVIMWVNRIDDYPIRQRARVDAAELILKVVKEL